MAAWPTDRVPEAGFSTTRGWLRLPGSWAGGLDFVTATGVALAVATSGSEEHPPNTQRTSDRAIIRLDSFNLESLLECSRTAVQRPSSKLASRGLTLLETGIAAFVFAIAVISFAALFSNAQASSARSIKRLAGTTLASRYLEEAVEEARFGAIPTPDNGTFTVRTIRRGQEQLSEYTWTRTVTTLPNDIHDVVVTVSWEYSSEPQTITREVLVHARP